MLPNGSVNNSISYVQQDIRDGKYIGDDQHTKPAEWMKVMGIELVKVPLKFRVCVCVFGRGGGVVGRADCRK